MTRLETAAQAAGESHEQKVARLELENNRLRAEIAAAEAEIKKAWNAFYRLRRAYATVRYPTLDAEIKLLYDTVEAEAKEECSAMPKPSSRTCAQPSIATRPSDSSDQEPTET